MALLRTDLRRVHRTASCQYGLITTAQARACGLSRTDIRTLVDSHRWRPAFAVPGVYSVRPFPCAERAPLLPLFRHAQAAQLALGPHAVASGLTAARLWGLHGLAHPAEPGPLQFTLPRSLRSRPVRGVRTNRWRIDRGDVVVRHGVRVTCPGRTLRDAALQTDRETAVSLMDSAVHQGLVHADRLPVLADQNTARPGSRRSRPWWPLSDGRSRNPLQTRLRLLCSDTGIPPDDLQHALPLPNGRRAYADLWWEKGPLAVEASSTPLRRADCDRHKAVLDAHPQIRLLRFGRRDLLDLEEAVKAIAEALRSSPRSPRNW
ncbi:type IV toxin-antitoxin system AbiEi family antitoxin domain-containing protein [Nocardiopsis halophila]|uniref:type IV toxin-antitoxin system AbiEi family antitoxin domain-containing protein n=1 Tax=Nocardiopsis halophila TaxID=141692 RepID=UPI0003487121|nr:type IV toxin-antitoxin system AbiEi family antitoxin domain-containing protein [Nocardiopsis halophila]